MPASSATGARTARRPAPSIMIARIASLSAVSGRMRRNGCAASGKRPVEKKTPEATNSGEDGDPEQKRQRSGDADPEGQPAEAEQHRQFEEEEERAHQHEGHEEMRPRDRKSVV